MSLFSATIAALLAADERAWETRPQFMMALMGSFVVVGVALIALQISLAAGNAFLVSFLAEMVIWLLRFRRKPVGQEEM